MPILILLLAAMAVEITVLVVVGNVLGVLATILLLVLATIAGGALLRREGTKAVTAFGEAVRNRRPPQREMADGVLIAMAGALIILPGFVSDVVALTLLFPPTRAVIRRTMLRKAEQRAQARGPLVVDSYVVRDEPDDQPVILIPDRSDDRRD